MHFNISNVNHLTHLVLSQYIKPGDRVADGTVGNGHDTLFLAQRVAQEGLVYGFDIQENALEKTALKLKENSLYNYVKLIPDSHVNMDLYINEKLSAVMFNLGYLPNSDRKLATVAATTLKALQVSLKLLKIGGIISVVTYQEHAGGKEEFLQVSEYFTQLPEKAYKSSLFELINSHKNAPYLFFCIKLKEEHQ